MTKSPHPSSVDKGELLPVTMEEYLICKNGYWYRPNAQGYTLCKDDAGRFTLDDAIQYSHPNGPDGPRDGISYEPAPPLRQAHSLPGDVGTSPLLALVAGYVDYKAISDDRWEQGKAAGYRELGEMVTAALTPSALSGDAGEVERLREALERIADGPGAGMGYIKGIGEHPIGESENMRQIALAALATEPTP